MSKRIFYILGGPGCGKGTLCAGLIDEFKVAHLSTGDLLRACVASGSEEGKRLQAIMQSGQLVDPETVLKLLCDAIAQTDKSIVLIDGFPRSLPQLIEFEKMGFKGEKAIFLDCSEETMIKRIGKRAGETPAEQRRADDNVETARKRFNTFRTESAPVIEELKKDGRCLHVNAERTADEVYADVRVIF